MLFYLFTYFCVFFFHPTPQQVKQKKCLLKRSYLLNYRKKINFYLFIDIYNLLSERIFFYACDFLKKKFEYSIFFI